MFPISLNSLSDQKRHEYILKTFILNKRKYKRDIDVIRENHRFLWNDDDDANEDSWELRLVKRYYDKLFKEYCIADLTRHKENKIALRWRTEAEVVAGIGQFQCGSRKCVQKDNLRSWEVNFAYTERGEQNNALVKLRLCPEHSDQLNYTSKKREVKRLKYTARDEKRAHAKSLKAKTKRKDHNDQGGVADDGSSNVGNKEENDSASNVSIDEEAGDLADDNVLEESEAIWNKITDVELEPASRESEFERYLEDLLI